MSALPITSRPRMAFDAIEENLAHLKDTGLYRTFLPCSHLADDPGHALYMGRRIQVWCSNDYLGMSQHPDVIEAQISSTLRHGTGNGGSRNIAGTSEAHVELESRMASWHRKARALIFTSGYVADGLVQDGRIVDVAFSRYVNKPVETPTASRSARTRWNPRRSTATSPTPW